MKKTYYGEKQQRGDSSNIQKRRNIITRRAPIGVNGGREWVRERGNQPAMPHCTTHTHILTCRETERAHTYLKRQRKQHIRKTENRKLVWTALHTHAHTPQFTTAVVGSTSAVYTSTTYTYIFSWKCSYRAHYMHTFSRHVSNLCEPVFTWAAVEWMAKMW